MEGCQCSCNLVVTFRKLPVYARLRRGSQIDLDSFAQQVMLKASNQNTIHVLLGNDYECRESHP